MNTLLKENSFKKDTLSCKIILCICTRVNPSYVLMKKNKGVQSSTHLHVRNTGPVAQKLYLDFLGKASEEKVTSKRMPFI